MKKPTCLILTGIGVLLLVLVLVFVGPMFVKIFQEMGDMLDLHAEYKRTLREYANEPLTSEQEKLLLQLLEVAATSESQNVLSLDTILSSEPYLTYINTYDGKEWTDYTTYFTAMPTQNHRNIVLTRHTGLLGEEMEVEEQEIWIDYYYILRNWSKTGKNQLNNKKEFEENLQSGLVEPLMERESGTGFTTKIVKMGMVSALMVEDSELFHNAWHIRYQTYGTPEGLLRCAIATPGEFALMRSFFEDSAAFEKWIKEPIRKDDSNEEQEGE